MIRCGPDPAATPGKKSTWGERVLIPVFITGRGLCPREVCSSGSCKASAEAGVKSRPVLQGVSAFLPGRVLAWKLRPASAPGRGPVVISSGRGGASRVRAGGRGGAVQRKGLHPVRGVCLSGPAEPEVGSRGCGRLLGGRRREGAGLGEDVLTGGRGRVTPAGTLLSGRGREAL